MNSEKRKQGFAAIDPELQKEIASRGGKAAYLSGNSHRFNVEQARAAGRKGGASISKDKEWMSKIGKLGAQRKKEIRDAEESSSAS